MEFKVKIFSGLLKYAGRMIGLSLFLIEQLEIEEALELVLY